MRKQPSVAVTAYSAVLSTGLLALTAGIGGFAPSLVPTVVVGLGVGAGWAWFARRSDDGRALTGRLPWALVGLLLASLLLLVFGVWAGREAGLSGRASAAVAAAPVVVGFYYTWLVMLLRCRRSGEAW